MIKAVIFDWGGVLIDNPAPGLMLYCANALGVSKEQFVGVFQKFALDFQRGRITETRLWEEICEELKVEKPDTLFLWKNAFQHVYSPKEEVFFLAENIHNQGYKVGFLSNTEIPAMEFFQEQQYNIFDATVFSCVEGIAKPERKIYEIALRKLQVEADRAIFIDDKIEFINGAKKLSINIILFNNAEQAERELAEFLR